MDVDLPEKDHMLTRTIHLVTPLLIVFLSVMTCKDSSEEARSIGAPEKNRTIGGKLLQFTPKEMSALPVASLDGGMIDPIADGKGNVLLINLWATWCPPCVEEMPSLKNLDNIMQGKKFRIYAISMGESRTPVEKFRNSRKLPFHILLDSSQSLFDLWGLESLPTTLVLDKKGRIRYMAMGSLSWDHPDVVKRLDELITED